MSNQFGYTWSTMPTRIQKSTLIGIDHRKRLSIALLLASWANKEGRTFPWRNSEKTPYEVLVAELLLKRTTAQAASRIYLHFLAAFPDLESITAADQSDLEMALSTVGLQKQRANGFKAMARFLVNQHDSIVPDDLDKLLEVPHIGEYAARAVMSFSHGRPAAVVDSNVVRVYGRLFARTLGSNPKLDQVQELADSVLPKRDHKGFNWAVLDLGALVCRYDRPRCGICPLAAVCDFNISLTLSRPA